MDDLFGTESETREKEADNYKCVFCKKMDIDNSELMKDRENVSCPYCQELVSNRKKNCSTWRFTKLPRKTSLPSAENCLAKAKKHNDAHGGALSCFSKFVIFYHVHDIIQSSLLHKAHIE